MDEKNAGQRRATSRRARSATTIAVAAAATALILAAPAARADVLIGSEWTPVSNSNGYTYFDGFTDYADGAPVTRLAQVNRGGNNWLQYTNSSGQYWGQLTAQMWANSAVGPASANANPRLEFDLD